jgi:CARDB protein
MRRGLVLALLSLLVLPAAAWAAPAHVRVRDCDPDAGTATFTGVMRAVGGTARLQMRLRVLVHPHGGDWARVAAPKGGGWVSAAPGRARFVYDQRLTGLQPGAVRVTVRFRWRAADGSVLKTAVRRSRRCRVPDPRPDLVPLKVARAPGAQPDTVEYAVTVANRGRSAAPASSVALDVGRDALPDAALPGLDPGERAVAAFEGPPCAPGDVLVVTADAAGVVDEAREADDVLQIPCG